MLIPERGEQDYISFFIYADLGQNFGIVEIFEETVRMSTRWEGRIDNLDLSTDGGSCRSYEDAVSLYDLIVKRY